MTRVPLSNVRPDPVDTGVVASPMEPFGERFTRGQGPFTLTGHLHHVGTHLFAHDIQAPTTVLECPTPVPSGSSTITPTAASACSGG